jgi:hypothetical protein
MEKLKARVLRRATAIRKLREPSQAVGFQRRLAVCEAAAVMLTLHFGSPRLS